MTAVREVEGAIVVTEIDADRLAAVTALARMGEKLADALNVVPEVSVAGASIAHCDIGIKIEGSAARPTTVTTPIVIRDSSIVGDGTGTSIEFGERPPGEEAKPWPPSCPKCGAEAGEPCSRVRAGAYHRERRDLADF